MPRGRAPLSLAEPAAPGQHSTSSDHLRHQFTARLSLRHGGSPGIDQPEQRAIESSEPIAACARAYMKLEFGFARVSDRSVAQGDTVVEKDDGTFEFCKMRFVRQAREPHAEPSPGDHHTTAATHHRSTFLRRHAALFFIATPPPFPLTPAVSPAALNREAWPRVQLRLPDGPIGKNAISWQILYADTGTPVVRFAPLERSCYPMERMLDSACVAASLGCFCVFTHACVHATLCFLLLSRRHARAAPS